MGFGDQSWFFRHSVGGMTLTSYDFSRYFTSPDLPKPQYVEGFQGNAIPLDGAVVAQLCVERLMLTAEIDD